MPQHIYTTEYHDEISSTNDRVQELLRQPIPPQLPCLVVARRQSAGRGRGNKRWWSSEGAIYMSLGFELSPEFLTRDQLPTFSATVAQSVIRVLSRHLPQHQLEVHLPNDVYVDGKKISGILLESPTPQYGILGIGLNVNNRLCDIPPEFLADFADRPITSMIELLHKETDIARLTSELLSELGFVVPDSSPLPKDGYSQSPPPEGEGRINRVIRKCQVIGVSRYNLNIPPQTVK